MNRRNRLRRSADIARVRLCGVKVVTPSLVLFVAPGARRSWRATVPVSVRFGSAAQRNRLRRRVREALRCQLQDRSAALDVLALPRARTPLASADELHAAVRRGLDESQSWLAA